MNARHQLMRDGLTGLFSAATFALWATTPSALAQGTPFWSAAGLAPGQFPVGFEVALLADSTRHLPTGVARPVQVSIWYPTPRPRGHLLLTYGNYVALASAETTTVDSTARAKRELEGFGSLLTSRGVPDLVVAHWVGAPMLAVVEAMLAPFPRFPPVVIAEEEGQSAQDQAVLAEFLASNGYVVATMPSPTRVTGPMRNVADTTRATQEQADDIAFVFARLRRRADVAERHLGLIGHGFGTRGALLFLMRTQAPKAFVSLDGEIGTAVGRASLEHTPSFDPTRAKAPLLHVYQELDSSMTPDLGLLRSLAAHELWLSPTRELHHRHFTALGAAVAAFPEIGEATDATFLTGSEYGSVLRLTLNFFDTILKSGNGVFGRNPALPLQRILPAK